MTLVPAVSLTVDHRQSPAHSLCVAQSLGWGEAIIQRVRADNDTATPDDVRRWEGGN